MDVINNINEAINILKDGDLLTSNNKDLFLYRKDRIHHYKEGAHYSLSVEEFKILFEKYNFYIKEESVEIDESKDEDYYRYYRK